MLRLDKNRATHDVFSVSASMRVKTFIPIDQPFVALATANRTA